MTNSALRGRLPARCTAAVLAAACCGLLAAACAGGSLAGARAAADPSRTSATLTAAAGPAAPGAAAGPVTPGAYRPTANKLPRCRTGQLSPAFTGLNSASGGQSGMTLILTNHSSHSCYLNGYVGLGLLGAHLDFPQPMPTHVTRVKTPHRPVRLRPGGNARALLTWRTSTLAGGRLEHPQRVKITPPGARLQLLGMWPKSPVNSGHITVWPLRPAAAVPVPTGTGTIRDPFNGMCVTAAGNGSADGTEGVAWQCDGEAAQQWTAYSDGTLRINGKCLDITDGSTAVGAPVDLWACDGGQTQQWVIGQTSLNPFGAIGSRGSGNVLTDPDGSTVDGTQLLMGADRGDLSGPWQVSFYHYLGH
jgi:ricin-type beta-trefoil lectin protein/uncharacterized protein DUF4232